MDAAALLQRGSERPVEDIKTEERGSERPLGDIKRVELTERNLSLARPPAREVQAGAALQEWGRPLRELAALASLQLRQVARLSPAISANDTASEEVDPNAADEPDTAPKWYITLAIGVGAALCILVFLIFLLLVLQVFVRIQQRYLEKLAAQQEAERAASRKSKAPAIGQEGDAAAGEVAITDRDVMQLVNGDSDRLEMLLHVAKSPDRKAVVADMVTRAGKAGKLRLGDESEAQITRGVLAVATTALEMSRKRASAGRTPREKLRSAFVQVRLMVKVSRAFNITLHDQDTRAMTNDTHEEAEGKYSEGAAKQSGTKDVKVKADSAIGAYFASERWVDHAGILFIFTYSQTCGIVYAFYLKGRFPKMYEFMGPWVLVSRGEAMSLILLTVLMVILLTRGIMTRLRKYCGWSTVLENIVDKHTMMHQWCGRMLPVCAALHILGHLNGSIPAIINEKDDAKINEVFTYGTKIKFNFNSWSGALRCYPAVTGFILVGILTAFWALSNEYVRRKYFELFHYPHLFLIVAWALGLWAHGARQWLGCGIPLGELVVVPVVCLYLLERIYHTRKAAEPQIKIVHAHVKKKSVLLEIDTTGSSFTYTTGMYCMLKVPAISNFQWHPFTIASAGGSPIVRVLFAVAGDWTSCLRDLCEEAKKTGTYPEICVRGGYGAPAENMKQCKHVVLVGAGVGATPFLSFLASICQSAERGEKSQYDDIETAVFYWLSREPEDFVWVNQYSSVIARHPSLRGRVSVRLVLTKSLETSATKECKAEEVALFWIGAQVALTHYNCEGLAKELGAPTQFGRPDWMKELGTHTQELLAKRPAPPEGETLEKLDVSVFACGNPMLVQALEDACDALDSDEAELRLFAEQF